MDFNEENINDPISISLKEVYEEYNLSEYISCSNPFNSRISSDKSSEDDLIKDYSGRELYEIIQNADDQHATTIEIELDSRHHLHIRNDGGRPFSNKGLRSVLRPHQSAKIEEAKNSDGPIGNKGLGIRSLLNWSDGMTIHSNGVRIAFSSTIASKKWDYILSNAPSLRALGKGKRCPLAILSVPEVTEDDVTSDNGNRLWTTEIEVACHDRVLEDIRSKMESLHTEVLLFLKHVRKIILKTYGTEKQLVRADDGQQSEADDAADAPALFTLLTEGDDVYKYAVFQDIISLSENQSDERKCIVSVAYATGTPRYCNYLYSFFPTAIPLKLPCVVHADFELTMSRNALTKCNRNVILMEAVGNLLVRTAEYRAKMMADSASDSDRLLPLKMLSPDEASCQMLPDFSAAIENNFDSCRVIPTIDRKYKSVNDHIYYNAQVNLNRFAGNFREDSLLNNYITAETYDALKKKNRTPENLTALYNQLSELASDLNFVEASSPEEASDLIGKASDLIVELLKVRSWDKDRKPSVLRLENGQIADSEERVYVLESKDVSAASKENGEQDTVAPKELKLKILHPLLSKSLQKQLSTDSRGLTMALRVISRTQDADFSHIKGVIESQSKVLSEEELNGVIRWLYRRWIRNGGSSGITGDKNSAPDCGEFLLFNAMGDRKPVCSLLLNSEDNRFRLNESHLEAVADENRTAFFIDYLGCAEALTLEPYNVNQDKDYLNIAMRDEKWTSLNRNIALIPANDFINNKSREEILSLIIKDRRFLRSLKNGTEISFVYYLNKTVRTQLSYSAYRLTHNGGKLSDVKNYVIPTSDLFDTSILNAGILDHDKLKEVDKEELNNLLQLLGAKTNPLKLSFAQLYQILEHHDNPSTAQKVYKEIRALMLRKEKELHEEAKPEEKNILQTVWATGPDGRKERRPKQEVFYWDNTRLPKKFLSSLWKLCLGARTGEQSVHRLFGVSLISDINLHVTDEQQYARPLTHEVREYLISRFKYFVAASLSEGEYKVETIRSKASDIRKFISSLRISHKFSYEVENRTMDAGDGDAVRDKSGYYICSESSTLREVIDNPKLCSGIAGGLCLSLKIDGENEWKFSHIIQASQRNIDYEWSELDETLCSDILRAIGVSDKEKKFWGQLGVILDEKDIEQERKRCKIINLLPDIFLPEKLTDIEDMAETDLYRLLQSLNDEQRKRLDGLYSLDEFYRNQMKNEFANIFSHFRSKTYNDLQSQANLTIEDINKWTDSLDGFHSKIIDHIEKQHGIVFKELTHLPDIVMGYIKILCPKLPLTLYPKLFMDNGLPEPSMLEPYRRILEKYNVAESVLKYNQKAIGYFEGFETEFEAMVVGQTASSRFAASTDNALENSDADITFFTSHKGNGHGSGNGGFTSSQTHERIGKSAEKRVKAYIESHPDLYESATDVSENHEHHCDLIYKRKGDPIQRHLEIKSVNGRKVFFTPREIEDGQNHSSTYDLALVYGDKVKIIPDAFTDGSELMANLSASTYEVSIEITDSCDSHGD